MVSIFSANKTRSLKPAGNIREEYSVQITIGLLSNSRVFYNFMYENSYTYLSRANPIYLRIIEQFTNTLVIFQIPTINVNEESALEAHPVFFYFCLSCKFLLQ
jgi:hypothetical protein